MDLRTIIDKELHEKFNIVLYICGDHTERSDRARQIAVAIIVGNQRVRLDAAPRYKHARIVRESHANAFRTVVALKLYAIRVCIALPPGDVLPGWPGARTQ